MKYVGEKMLPVTRSLLETLVAELKKEANSHKRSGMENLGGDAYHDPVFNQSERNHDTTQSRRMRLKNLLDMSEVAEPPQQNRVVEVGHEVEFELEEKITGHIITRADGIVLIGFSDHPEVKKALSNISGILVSKEAPLGQTLIGHRRGEIISSNTEDNQGLRD